MVAFGFISHGSPAESIRDQAFQRQSEQPKMIEMNRTDDVISVSFPSETFLGETILRTLHDDLQALLDKRKPRIVRFDLTRVAMITSEILGFFVSLHEQNLRVQICNPSDDVRSAIEVTRLDELLELVSDRPTTD